MPSFSKVLVALGGDALDGALLIQLRSIVGAFAPTEVHAVTAISPSAAASEPAKLSLDLEQDLRVAVDVSADVNLTTAFLRGSPLDALLAYVREKGIDLVIVGHRRGARSHSLARRLARQAPCAILMVTDRSAPVLGRVLVSVDFSPASAHTLDVALELCRALRVPECMVLNVYTQGDLNRLDEDEIRNGDAPEELARLLAGRNTQSVKIVPIFEEAADVVSGVARVAARTGADLICMGARGRSRAAAVLLGSATEDVLSLATCPVLVIRTPGHPLSLLDVIVQRVFTETDRPRPV